MLTPAGARLASFLDRLACASWAWRPVSPVTIATPAAPVRPLRAATLDEVLAAYDAYCGRGTTLSASGDLDVRDRRTGKARRLGVRVLAGRGGRLYLKGSVAVVTALEVVADGERFWFQVPSQEDGVDGGGRRGPRRGRRDEQAPY